MTKAEYQKEIERLFEILKTGERGEVKAVKKQIEKLYHDNRTHSKNSGEIILGIIDDFENIKDIEHKIAVLSGLNLPVLYLVDKHFDELSKFILKNLENSDGRIREGSRHLASWLRIESEKNKKSYENFIDTIEVLMKKYEPEEKPFYIGDTKPSVYKSLVIFWHSMVYGTSMDYEHCEELMDPLNEDRIPFLGQDDDDFKEEVDYDEVLENVWADKKEGNPEDATEWLKHLEEMSQKRLLNQIKSLGFSESEADNMLATLRVFGVEATTGIINDILMSGKISHDISEFSRMNNFMREMYAFSNHRIINNEHGNVSHLLVRALIEKECVRSGQPSDLVSFIKLICQSHEAIDAFMDLYENKSKERLEWRISLVKKYTQSEKDEEDGLKDVYTDEKEDERNRFLARSVAHHTLDWYIQGDPAGFSRINDPKKVSAYILKMVKDYNIEATDCGVYLHYDNKDLSEFGGWKSTSGLNGTEYKIARPILEVLGDPTLLLIDPSKFKDENRILSI